MKFILLFVLAFSVLSCNQSDEKIIHIRKNDKSYDNKINIESKKFNNIFLEKTEVELKPAKGIYIARISDLLVRKGNYIVNDRRGKQVLIFDQKGNFKNILGRLGKGPGEYVNVASIDINSSNEILVLDVGNMKVSKYNMGGKFIKSFNINGFASRILADNEDGFYLYDPLSAVKPIDKDIIFHYDGNGRNDFNFCKPFFETGIGGGSFRKDIDGNLYASHSFCFLVRKYSSKGKNLGSIIVKSDYIRILKLKNNEPYPPVSELNESSSITDFVINSKYILVQIRGINGKNIINIYDYSGNLLKSNIILPLHLLLATTGDDNMFYFIQEPGENLSLDIPNYKIIMYDINVDE